MNLTLIIAVVVSVTSAAWLYQLFSGRLSLFAVGLTLVCVSAACSGFGFIRDTSRARTEPDRQQ